MTGETVPGNKYIFTVLVILLVKLILLPWDAGATEELETVEPILWDAVVMDEMGAAEMGRVTAGYRQLAYTADAVRMLEDGAVSTRIYEDGFPADARGFWMSDMQKKGLIYGGRPISLTIRDLNADTWVMEETRFFSWNKRQAEANQLWLVIDNDKVRPSYYDYYAEGWETADNDYALQLRKELNQMNLTGADDKPLRVDTIVHSITYDPWRYERVVINEPTYHIDGSLNGYKSIYGVQECLYRRAYMIYFQYE